MNNISKREFQVITDIKERDMVIFTPYQISRFLSISDINTNRILQSMKKKDLIRCVERGKYILTETEKELDIYEIASDLFKPSYISFWSAMYFHKMTEQVPRRVFLATTKRKRSLHFQGQEMIYVTLKKEMFFGYQRMGRVLVSDPEKTIIDCIRHPEHSGGMDNIYRSITEDLDPQKIVEYCIMTESSTIASRLGYMLESKGMDFNKERLRSFIRTYSKLDPGKDKKDPDPVWKLYRNRVLV